MATESASSRPRGKGKNGRKLVDFDEFIHAQFAKTRGSLRSVDVLSALAQWFTAALVFFFAVVMLDHWIIPGGLAVWTRWISLAVLVLGSAGYLAYAVGVPLLRRISLPFAARTIERSDPTLKNNLINFLDLRRRQEEFSPAVLELVEQQTATDLTHVEVENAVSREGLVKVSYVMLGMVVLGCAYVLLSPKSPFTTFGRVLAPAADISPPTKVTIIEVLPGDAQVFAGDELEVTAATGISDGITPDRMTLYYTTASRKYVDEPLDMVPVPDRPRHWRARLRGDSSRSAGLQEDFTYRLHAGDYTTRDYRINVIQAPSVRVEQVVYDFPQYTGFERRVLDVGDLDALEGTTVTLTATTNMPVKHGGIDFDGDLKTDLVLTRREDPESRGDRLEGKFVLGFKPDGTPRYERYQVLFETLDGETNPNPILYRIQTRRDYPPTVSIPHPGRDLSWPANTPLRIEIEAEDKDFALRRVILHVTQGRQSFADRDLGVGTDLGGTLSTVYNLDLAQFDLQAGDVIQYWAEALDNKEPQANRAESTRYEVRILSPLSPEEKEQLIADASEQIEQQRRQSEEAQHDEEGAPGEEAASEDSPEQAEGDDKDSEIEGDAKTLAKILEKLQQEHDGDESDEQSRDDSGDDSQSPQPNESGNDQQEPAGAQQKSSENGEEDSSDPDEKGSQQEDSSGLPSGIGKPQNQAQADDESSSAEEGGTGQAGESGSNDQQSEAPPGGNQPSESDSESNADSQSGTEGSEPSDDPSNADSEPGPSDQPGTESTQPSNSQQNSERRGSEDDTGSDSSPSSDSEETGKEEGSTDSGTPKLGADPETPAQPGTEKPKDAVPQASDKPGEAGDSATQNEPRESDPQSPSHQTDRSDKRGRDSGNAPGDAKPSPGQQAPQPGKGQEGSGEQGEQGGKPSDQQGSSDATRPGQQTPSDQPTGQGGPPQGSSETSDPDENRSEGSKPSDSPESQDGKQPSDASGQPMGDSQASDSSQNNSNSDQQGSPSDSSQQDGQANQQEGSGKGQGNSQGSGTPKGGKVQSGSGNQNPGNQVQQGDQSDNSSSKSGGGTGQSANQEAEGESPDTPDPANEEYAKKPTELALDFLRNHKKQDTIDPELAKELGRTPEQLKKLMERLEKYQADAGKDPASLSPEEAARLRAFEESVRRHRLKNSSFERSTTGTRTDPRAVFQGDRSQIPPEYREQFEAYLRSVSRNSKPKSGR